MSRHTLNDGVTPHPAINSSSYDAWWQELAPSAKLLGDYYKRNLPWDNFSDAYNEYLRTSEISKTLPILITLALQETVTLLCIETEPLQCHRRLLAESCKIIEPSLVIDVA